MKNILGEYLSKRREKKIYKWRPELVKRWRESIEENIRKEYVDEIEKLGDELFKKNQELTTVRKDRDKWKHRYEESQEVRDKLLDKVEKTSTKAGVLRNEVKALNDELKEVKEHSSIVEDNVTQTEDISTSDIDNPNVQQTEEIIDRIKNSTIGKLGKKKKERK